MVNRKRIMFVFGTRPEAIKMAPVIKEVEKYPDMLEPVVVVTGQHRQLLDQVMRIFDLDPDYDLGIMEENQTIGNIVTKSLQGLEEIILREKPDMLLVQGDTSTAFAAALAAFYYRIPLGHVEAGLRTFDKWRPYPEEMNRKLISDLADLHFPPTRISAANLLAENIPKEKIYLTGNTVIDALLSVAKRNFSLEKAGIKLGKGKKTVLVTAHRRESFGQPLRNICAAIKRLAEKYRREIEFVIPVHRNPMVRNAVNELLESVDNVELIEPLDYEAFVHLMKASYIILTDSGGVQEEAPSLGKPVLVMREKTERPDAVEAGTVKLVGLDENVIFNEADRLLSDRAAYEAMSKAVNPYGDGLASERIVGVLLHYFGASDQRPEDFNVKTVS
ncbi:UDP-N-acetylglucosamine 2-epimerase [candidate division WOR-1 bacterium RIFCSPHIGHO2_01_FULL_53_15]|uniref:UDP-N-acetylglucosamine 2-epimerase (non-hydrolyzing) n=1 Tax=candidate division WOR-1 bacterium RIFCSPHIGHO2_01_FULL_53_15 TaxID=1802564 RepID=A0A1F4Q455_UNCSA|nr:MAG: UDP-N-acetylglucosamine 2-epimerase [candidate division WOR-1 bacterium RIFCSPHIGHO2_01_FULL_53_15]OGC13264.1 MAG: UDP-N-acetylglucosamine 2-epimerase [candidate division WOR-1 bacterium RIFCSPHIGHO2_02_FULL_53_26]